MGCDIHCYVEYRKKGSDHWGSFGGRINPGRDYQTFEKLAGVRGNKENALVKPRGAPSDLGFYARDDLWLFIVDKDDVSEGFCTRDQAREYHKQGSRYRADNEGFVAWVEHPDWHSHSWLTPDEWEKAISDADIEYHAMLSAMRTLEDKGKNEVRVVFWFDN